MAKQLFLPLAGVAAFIVLVGFMVQGKIGNFKPIYSPSSKPTSKIVKIDEVEIEVEIVKTDSERQIGLSNRESLNENSGMLFVLPENSKPTFWMKDTLIPLDMIWIKDGKVIGIEENVSTQIEVDDSELTLYPAPGVVDYVLEVNAGFSIKNKLEVGSTIVLPEDI